MYLPGPKVIVNTYLVLFCFVYSVAALQSKGFSVSSLFLIVGDYLSCSSPLSSDVGSTVAQIVRS